MQKIGKTEQVIAHPAGVVTDAVSGAELEARIAHRDVRSFHCRCIPIRHAGSACDQHVIYNLLRGCAELLIVDTMIGNLLLRKNVKKAVLRAHPPVEGAQV